MTNLPVIVGFGGYNAAGRSSFHHGFRRTVLESLNTEKRISTLLSLATIMKLVEYQDGHYVNKEGEVLSAEEVADKYQTTIEQNTLIRRIHESLFDADKVLAVRELQQDEQTNSVFTMRRRDLPSPLPENWKIEAKDDNSVDVTISGKTSFTMRSFRKMDLQSAGSLPTGFEPADYYNSRFHPRGLQMTILGASDALNSVGIPWQKIMEHVRPDDVAVFAVSGLGQVDEYGISGYTQARLHADRPTAKQMALGLNSMPADFVNAYVCGSVGTTGAIAGACASFLYNLRVAVEEIVSGRHRVVICGCSEAPVNPEVIEGFSAMGAMATDERLAKLDGVEKPDYRRASRPFGENCGFTMGESSQFVILMDDALALELGADIHGAIPDVFINADGYKKSISSPGAGNYVTLAKAVAKARSIVGDEAIRERSFIQSHGSSTPQNRVTESIIFDKVASGFGIKDWPVTAVKAFVGHPLGPASGDQLISALGTFADDVIPGIKTTHEIADDVVDENLEILLKDKEAVMDVAFLNSKGFGGNNATATVLSAKVAQDMLQQRYGKDAYLQYTQKREQVRNIAKEYDEQALNGELNVIYNFGQDMIVEENIEVTDSELTINEFKNSVDLTFENPYSDMTNV